MSEATKQRMERLGVLHMHTTKGDSIEGLTDHYPDENDPETEWFLTMIEESQESNQFLCDLIKATDCGIVMEGTNGMFTCTDTKTGKEYHFTKQQAKLLVDDYNASK